MVAPARRVMRVTGRRQGPVQRPGVVVYRGVAMRCGATARGVLVTAVRVRAGRFGASERSLVNAKAAKSREGTRRTATAFHFLCLLFFATLRGSSRASRDPADSDPHTASSQAGAPMRIPPDDLTGACINSALRIHRKFRSGMLENAYETFLFRTLVREGFNVERQKRSPSSSREIAMRTRSAPT